MKYIKVEAAYEKLKEAENSFRPVIMTAAHGWGKSAAARYYYRRKNPLIMDCAGGHIKDMPNPDSIRRSIIIIDNMQWLSDEESINYLHGLLERSRKQIVMITRGNVPQYLAADELKLGFVRITEADLAFGRPEVRDYFTSRSMQVSEEDLSAVTDASEGYPLAVFCYANRMEHGEPFSADIKEAVWQDLFHLWDGCLYAQWNAGFREFAMAMCEYDSFTAEMAAKILDDPSVDQLIEYCMCSTNQLNCKNDGYFKFRHEIRRFFKWKKRLIWPREKVIDNYRRAALYYEERDDILNALKYYKLAQETDRIRKLLIREASLSYGMGRLVELKDHYFEMDEAEVSAVPVLMAGMSKLCSILLMKEESELWYRRLSDFEKDKSRSQKERKEARIWLAYLDIALPHRGTKNLPRIIKNNYTLLLDKDVKLPEFSVTGNTPSVMNGALDFCDWTKEDIQLEKTMRTPVEAITGRFGKGLAAVSLAESGFEKGTAKSIDVLAKCSAGYSHAVRGGSAEIAFASVGVQAKQYILNGEYPMAQSIFDSFVKYAGSVGADRLKAGTEAFGVYLSMFSGNSLAESFIEKTPDARAQFSTLDRYTQMIRLKALIAVGELEKAADLSYFLDGYFEEYDRKYYRMQNLILKSVILFRMNEPSWKEHLVMALKAASKYHFVRLFSLEGAAVAPLLIELSRSDQIKDIPKEYFAQVLDEAGQTALYYPDYLKYIPHKDILLTRREAQILSMLCAGMTSDEICEKCGITYACLKKHNRGIYAKLGASNRAEAERKAMQTGLVHRGRD